MTTRRNDSGFTMVEVLVALVVLAIGLLGIAALYLNSLQSGRTAIYRTQAINLAADLADRIRMNRTAQAAYNSLFADDEDVVGDLLDDWRLRRMPTSPRPTSRTGRTRSPINSRTAKARWSSRRRSAVDEPASYLIVVRWARSRRSGAGDLPARVPDMKRHLPTPLRERSWASAWSS